MKTELKHYYNVKEVAEILGVSTGAIYQMIYRGEIPYLKVSYKCVRFAQEDVEAFIEKRKVRAFGRKASV